MKFKKKLKDLAGYYPPLYLYNNFDNIVNFISPEWGAKRKAGKIAMEKLAYYRASERTRLSANWVLGQDKANPPTYELTTLRENINDLYRKDPVTAGMIDAMTTNVIGTGLRPIPQIRAKKVGISEKKAEKLNELAEEIYQEASEYTDFYGRSNMDEVCRLAHTNLMLNGEIIALFPMVEDKWRDIKTSIQLIDSTYLGDSRNQIFSQGIDKGRNVLDSSGVELNKFGQPVKYYFRDGFDISDTIETTMKFRSVPARDEDGRLNVVHMYKQIRPGQIRGVPDIAQGVDYLRNITEYLEAVGVGQRVAACLSVFITQSNPYSGINANYTSTDANSHRLQTVEPGLINYLGPGESINVVEPKQPGQQFDMFLSSMLRIVCMLMGVPYEIIVKDFSKTNYSSARAALLEGWKNIIARRNLFIDKLVKPYYARVIEEAYLRGRFNAPGNFYQHFREYIRCQWVGPGRGWVDPEREVNAAKKMIDYGISTLADEVQGITGGDWKINLHQKAKEENLIDELDLDIPVLGGLKNPTIGEGKPSATGQKEGE